MSSQPALFPSRSRRVPQVRPLVVAPVVRPITPPPDFLPSDGPYDSLILSPFPVEEPEFSEPSVAMFRDTGIPYYRLCDLNCIIMDFSYTSPGRVRDDSIILPNTEGTFELFTSKIDQPLVDTNGEACVIKSVRVANPFNELLAAATRLAELWSDGSYIPPFAHGEPRTGCVFCETCGLAVDIMRQCGGMWPYGLTHYLIGLWKETLARMRESPCTCKLSLCLRLLQIAKAIFRGVQ